MSNPIVVYTGTAVWDGPPEIRDTKKGRAEHGPGLYFTTSLETARRYAKGRGTVLRVEISPSIRWLEGAVAPVERMVEWVESRRGLRKKREIVQDLRTRSGGRGVAPGMGRVEVLVNLMVNYEAISGSHGPSLAEFLVSLGIGASLVDPPWGTRTANDEQWLVLFDPEKVLGWRRIQRDDPSELPSIRSLWF